MPFEALTVQERSAAAAAVRKKMNLGLKRRISDFDVETVASDSGETEGEIWKVE